MRVAVGIPTWNEVNTIDAVTRVADEGLSLLSGDGEIWLADGGSTDETVNRFLRTPTGSSLTAFSFAAPPGGKGQNVLGLIKAAVEKSVDALVIVDADVSSASPNWISKLATPVLTGQAEYVSPIFGASQGGPLRHLISRPLVVGFMGGDIPQPTGGEICLSLEMCRRVLNSVPSDSATLGYGIDIYLALDCIGASAPFALADLGIKTHRARAWSSITFIAEQVAEAAFRQLHRFGDRVWNWSEMQHSVSPDVSETLSIAALNPTVLDLDAVRQKYVASRGAYLEFYRRHLPDDDDLLNDLLDATEVSGSSWQKIISNFAGAAVVGEDPHELASALMPLMLGRMVSYGEQLTSEPQVLSRSLDNDLQTIATDRHEILARCSTEGE